MKVLALIARRFVLGIATIWAVLTGIFLLFTQTTDWHLDSILAQAARGQGTTEEEIQQAQQAYLAARGLDKPFPELYLEWMERMFTLQWGETFEMEGEAFSLVMSATARTMLYVAPAVVLATLVGLTIGIVTAITSGTRGEGTTRSLSYFGLGIPNFWIGAVILILAGGVGLVYTPTFLTGQAQGTPEIAVMQWSFLYEHLLPTLLVATTLVAAIASYARAYSLQYYADDLTKLVRAKGGSRLDVARHVLRNAAVPLVSLLVAETLALIALAVFVIEAVFAIGGIGALLYNAVWVRDLPIIMGATMVIVALGVLGTLLQDLLYAWLDPRVDVDTL